jgi:hypothetical protein
MFKPTNNAEVRTHSRFGKGLFATKPIHKDEAIAEFDGLFYEAGSTTQLPLDVADHAIQCAPHLWRDSVSIARYINHSCERRAHLGLRYD